MPAGRHDLPPGSFGGGDLAGQGFGDGKQCWAVVVGDTVQAKAHKIESSGEGQRLVEGFLHFAREPEDTPP
jgi:hypothetical protein